MAAVGVGWEGLGGVPFSWVDTLLWRLHKGGQTQVDKRVHCLYWCMLPGGDTVLLPLDSARGKQGRACVPVAEPLDMTAGVKAGSGDGALPAQTWY